MSIVDQAHDMLVAAQAGPVDSGLLDELNSVLALEPSLRAPAALLIRDIIVLARLDPQKLLEIPGQLVSNILTDLPLSQVFEVITPPEFEEGFTDRPIQGLLVDLLARVEKPDLAGPVRPLLKQAVGLLLEEHPPLSSVEKLTSRLASLGVLGEFVPFQQLATGSAEQQTRLMAVNLLLAQNDQEIPLEFLTIRVEPSDVLALAAYLDYLRGLFTVASPARVAGYIAALSETLDGIGTIYSSSEEPLLNGAMEDLFIAVASRAPDYFATLDMPFELVTTNAINLLAGLPPAYLYAHHQDTIKRLTLTPSTTPAYANLATDVQTYRLLDLSAQKLADLPLDYRIQIVAGASKSYETARLFVERFPTIMDAIFTPSTLPGIAALQHTTELNLRTHGLHTSRPAPAVATSHDQ